MHVRLIERHPFGIKMVKFHGRNTHRTEVNLELGDVSSFYSHEKSLRFNEALAR